MQQSIAIYTDGGCLGNPGPGAWAYCIVNPTTNAVLQQQSDKNPSATNNQMELQAVISALQAISKWEQRLAPVQIYTDSQYVQKGITMWIHLWIANNWIKKDKKPVKNVQLWKQLYELSKCHDLQWHWVRGHAGNKFNELCHKLLHRELAH